MDIFSHGLWGGIIWGRKNRRSFWLSFMFGISPDLFSFGIFTFLRILQFEGGGFGKPELESIPKYVHTLYDITHSYVVFSVVFALVWIILKRPVWEMTAWAFHIFLDMFTHSERFFPTPIVWPFSDTSIDGVPWSAPEIFFTNAFFLIVIYGVFWYRKIKHKSVL